MTRFERAKIVMARLAVFFPEPPIPLAHENPFTLLVAVILSAQCTDKRVNQVTPALFALADTAEKMAPLPVSLVNGIVRPCGLAPRKAENIVATAKILCEKFGGVVPKNFEDLESLPGVGHKTASVVMSQAFGFPAFPVDTHIHRLARRWHLSGGKNVVQTERDLRRVFPECEWHRLHLQMIFYGREFCTARGCDGFACPICRELNGTG